jgi:hypothetical protein
MLPSKKGGIALFTSCYDHLATGLNNWHAVAVLRKGNTIWIFNPEYTPGTVEGFTQISAINGIQSVQKYVKFVPGIKYCFITGMGDIESACIGRSLQWMESFLNGTLTDSFESGKAPSDAWQELSRTGIK